MKESIKSKSKAIIVFQIIFMLIFGSILVQPTFAINEPIHVVQNDLFNDMTLLSASEGRILFMDDSNYGYLDYDGQIVIPAQFEDAENFSSGIARVSTDDGDAYIDKSGNVVFTLKAVADTLKLSVDDLTIYDFSEGFARIDNYDSIGYIDTKGEIKVPLGTYYDGNDFVDGMTMVYDEDYEDYFINTDGTKAFKNNADYDYYSFSNHRAVVYDYDSGQYGYVDEKGKLVVPFTLDDAFDFQGHIALFEEDGKYGVLNEMGTVLVKPIFREAQITEEGYVVGDDGVFTMILDNQMKPMYKFLDTFTPDVFNNLYIEQDVEEYLFKDFSGNIVGHYRNYDYLGDYIFIVEEDTFIDTHNVKAVPMDKNKFNVYADYDFKFVDNTGKVVLDLSDYDDVKPFSEGRAVVEKNGKYGYIDKTGAVVIPIKYDSADAFNGGEAYVYYNEIGYTVNLEGTVTANNDDYGYTEDSNSDFYTISKGDYGDVGLANKKTDQIVLQPKYSSIEEMGNDIFLLETDYLYGYYDAKSGKLVEPIYEDLAVYSDDKVIVVETEDYKYGMYDFEGKLLLEYKYDYIQALEGGLYEVTDENQLTGIVDHKGNVIVKPEYDYIESYITDDNILILGLEKGDDESALIYDLKKNVVINRNVSGYPVEIADNSMILEAINGETSIVSFNGNTIFRTSDRFVETVGDYYEFIDDNDVYYIVDKSGKEYLKDNAFYDLYLPVENGYMIFMQDDKFGIVSLDGTVKTNTLYTQVSYLNAGVMAVYENGQFGYVSVDGKNIVKMGKYDYIYNFTDGLGLVIKANN